MTEELIKRVKADRAKGMEYKQIAKKYGINVKTASSYGRWPEGRPFGRQIWAPRSGKAYQELLPDFLASDLVISAFCRQNNIGIESFKKFLEKQGVAYVRKTPNQWTKDEVKAVKVYLAEGLNYDQIAQKMGRKYTSIKYICDRHFLIRKKTAKPKQKKIKPLEPPKPLSTDGKGRQPTEWRFRSNRNGDTMQRCKYDLRQYPAIMPSMWQREQVQNVANVLAWSHEEAREAIKYTRNEIAKGG